MRLGATDFEQRVLYRRALEGELTRTIATLGAVESSRVHLVLPEKSVFVSRSEPATASIILRLHPGRTLVPSEVAAIVHLVSAAVPSLDPDHVSVVTTDGTTLHKPRKTNGADDALGGDEDLRSIARSYESSVEERVRAMLERVVGPGHADVRVTAEIDAARVERIEDRYDPSKGALRSEEQSIERTANDTEESVAGVPGAESNLPTGAAKDAAKADGGATASATPGTSNVRESHTRNFEIDHVQEKRVSGGGALHRLTVAVVLDGSKDGKGDARSPAELDKLAALVRSAAGTSEARGDVVTLESIPFVDGTDSPAEAPTQVATALTGRMAMVKRYGPYAAGALLVLVLVVGGLVRRSRGATAERTKALAAATLAAELPAAAEAPALLGHAEAPALDSGDLRTRAHSRAAQDPATAALVLRFWLGTSTPDSRDSAKA